MKWLIVSATSGILSAVGIAQETRTTSLLLSRWAAFLAALVIALDMVIADLVAAVIPESHGMAWPTVKGVPWLHHNLAWVAVGALAPALLRGFKLPIGNRSEGIAFPYTLTRRTLLIRLDDEFGTRMEMKARLIARKALENELGPKDLAAVMKALASRHKTSRATEVQLGQILGALRAGGLREQMERLVELMYHYRMRALIRDIETGRITKFLQPSRHLYTVRPHKNVRRPVHPPPLKPPGPGKPGPSQPSSHTHARPDPDPEESDRSGHSGRGQDLRGT
jgi:hypothetical protein